LSDPGYTWKGVNTQNAGQLLRDGVIRLAALQDRFWRGRPRVPFARFCFKREHHDYGGFQSACDNALLPNGLQKPLFRSGVC
jgi:hypothetical protein